MFFRQVDGSGILQEFQKKKFSPVRTFKEAIGSMQNFSFLPLGWDVDEIFTTDGIAGSQSNVKVQFHQMVQKHTVDCTEPSVE